MKGGGNVLSYAGREALKGIHEACFKGLDMNIYSEKWVNGKAGEQHPSKTKVF